MFDLVAFVLPRKDREDEILLMNMEENVKKVSGPQGHVSFLDKLIQIKSLYSKMIDNDNYRNNFFAPFLMAQDLKYDESINIINVTLSKLSERPPAIRGHILLSRRFILYPHLNYKFIIYFTDPVDPKDLKVTNIVWCNKDLIKNINSINDYFIVGNEIDKMLKLAKSGNFTTTYDKCLHEYRLNAYDNSMPFGFTKILSLPHKIIIQSNCDKWIQNYVFADFMMNSYPCQVMSYPQFIGFVVARGIYMKRCLRLFKVFKNDHVKNMIFEEFLHGCICMDLSSPHEGDLRVARGNLIFKYYDYNDDNVLDFPELFCMVKRMRKKIGLGSEIQEVTIATEHIMKLLDKKSTINDCKISLKKFQAGLHLPELQGLTYLLRFSMKYLSKTRPLMKKYVESVEEKMILIRNMNSIEYDFSLIPYFINEAYSNQELFASMIYYSTNYGTIQNLLQKLDGKNKLAVATYKVKTVFNAFISQVFYYLSEIAFDIYHNETEFPLRNPIFLILLFTAIAIVDPQMFHSSLLFWNNLFSFFIFNSPAFILALKRYQQDEVISSSTESPNIEGILSDHWISKQNSQIKRNKLKENESKLTIFEQLKQFYYDRKNNSRKSSSQTSSKLINDNKDQLPKKGLEKTLKDNIDGESSVGKMSSNDKIKSNIKESNEELQNGLPQQSTIKRNVKNYIDFGSTSSRKNINSLTDNKDLQKYDTEKICKDKSERKNNNIATSISDRTEKEDFSKESDNFDKKSSAGLTNKKCLNKMYVKHKISKEIIITKECTKDAELSQRNEVEIEKLDSKCEDIKFTNVALTDRKSLKREICKKRINENDNISFDIKCPQNKSNLPNKDPDDSNYFNENSFVDKKDDLEELEPCKDSICLSHKANCQNKFSRTNK